MKPTTTSEKELARFNSRFVKSRGCWNWTGAKNSAGYGIFKTSELPRHLAHRYSWQIFRGPIPKGLNILHTCDNRACVNPQHLFMGTRSVNGVDRHTKGRTPIGESAGRAKLKESMAIEILQWNPKLSGESRKELASRMGVSEGTITAIRLGVNWSHLFKKYGKGRSKSRRVSKYPWDKWLSKSQMILLKGIHYTCKTHSMCVQIRGAALKRGIQVHVLDRDTKIQIISGESYA